jgi:hypothetical protein
MTPSSQKAVFFEATMTTDLELLDEVLAKDLPDDVRGPFQDMHDKLHHGRLTPKQRAWVESVARTIGVDVGAAPAENLVSSGRMQVRPEERANLAAFHKSLGPLPMKPPGRR